MLLGTFNIADLFYSHPQIYASREQFVRPHGLVFALMPISALRPYIDRCVPFQMMSKQLNLPQRDSSQGVETSQR